MILASNPVGRNIAILIAIVITIGWLAYWLGNMRRSKAEVGSEIELAPNRKPYLDDEELEGAKLDRVLLLALGLLVVTAVALPAVLAERAEPAGGRDRGLRREVREVGLRAVRPDRARAASTAPAATAPRASAASPRTR